MQKWFNTRNKKPVEERHAQHKKMIDAKTTKNTKKQLEKFSNHRAESRIRISILLIIPWSAA
jgi:hypothetical protein